MSLLQSMIELTPRRPSLARKHLPYRGQGSARSDQWRNCDREGAKKVGLFCHILPPFEIGREVPISQNWLKGSNGATKWVGRDTHTHTHAKHSSANLIRPFVARIPFYKLSLAWVWGARSARPSREKGSFEHDVGGTCFGGSDLAGRVKPWYP